MKNKKETDIERSIISNWLLNEKTLLVISQGKEDKYPIVSIRYLKNNEIHSKDIAELTPDTKVEHNERMIAMFKREGKSVKRYKLAFVYDVANQKFLESSSMHLYYDYNKFEGAKIKTLATPKK